MLKDSLTLLIHSCDKFSDLWDAHVKLLNQNWGDRNIRTIILSDTPRPDVHLTGVEIIGAGEGKEITERIRYALPLINTEYVLVTLDDYFLTSPIDTARIQRLVDIMEKDGMDYIRLFDRPHCQKFPTSHKGVCTFELTGDYRVNLYAGIWRRDFIERTLGEETLNAWQFEVTLTNNAREANGKCAVSDGNEFPILDVVRKGRILPKAWTYLKKHDLYHGPRTRFPRSAYTWLGIKTRVSRLLNKLPDSWKNPIKATLVKCGVRSFSASKN